MQFNLPEIDWKSMKEFKTGREWDIPLQLKKIGEEYGEVCEAVARGVTPEIIEESLDVMQTCKTLIEMELARHFHHDRIENILNAYLMEHLDKLKNKGYLKKEE